MFNPCHVAIVAGGGVFERASILKFRSSGIDLRVMARTEVAAERSLALGADETVVGSFDSVQDFSSFLDGIDVLVFNAGLGSRRSDDTLRLAIDAVKANRSCHLLFVSCLRPLTPDLESFALRVRCEAALAASGIRYSILQPAMFMQNIGFLLPNVERTGSLAWPWNVSHSFAMVDAMDVAEAAVNVATRVDLEGGTYELCAQVVTPVDIADQLSRTMGMPLLPVRASPSKGVGQSRLDVVPSWSPESLVGAVDELDRHGYQGGSSFVLRSLLGRAPTSVDAFVRSAVRAYLSSTGKQMVDRDTLLDAMFASWSGSEL